MELEAVGREMEAPAEPSRELSVEVPKSYKLKPKKSPSGQLHDEAEQLNKDGDSEEL